MGDEKESGFDWILTAKGIGILLVVIGQFRPDMAPLYWV